MRPYIFIPGLLFALLFSTFFSLSLAQTITTIAGGIGDDTTAIIYGRTFRPSDFARGVGGDVVFADLLTTNSSRYFRKLDPVTGIITSIPAPFGTSLIKVGSDWYYIYNGIVYKQSASGVVTQVAGSGTSFYSGDGGLATSAGVSPKGIAFDNSGNLYIADGYNRRVRKVNTLGIISTVPGSGSSGFSGDGGNALLASLKNDGGIALDAIGNLYIMDDGNNRIRKVDPSGIITTFAGGGTQTGNGVPATMAKLVSIKSIAEDGLGNLYVATRYAVKKIDGSGTINTVAGTETAGYSGDGGPATSARLNEVANVAFDGAGNFYIADQNNSRIRKVNSAGVITTVVGNNLPFSGFGGDGGSPLLAVFANINSLAADRFGNIFIADGLNNRVRKLNASGSINTVAGNGFSGFVGDGVPATDAAIDYPTNIAVDKFGNLFITSYNNHHIRKVNSAGTVSIYAGGGADPGDGIPATAALIAANGLTVDTAGNVYFSELETRRVRKIDVVTGLVTTIAGGGSISAVGIPATTASLSDIYAVAADLKGNIFIAGDKNYKVDTAGVIYRLPLASNAVAVDTMGNAYFNYNGRIVRYDVYDYLTTMNGYLTGPIAIDEQGNFYSKCLRGTGVGKICCLPNTIDKPPVFVKGPVTNLSVCRSSVDNGIDSLLSFSDGDTGDNEQWTIISNPLHGTLGGFPHSVISTGDTIIPSGFTYTPTAGYQGSDYFRVRISDGTDTGSILINVNVTGPAMSQILFIPQPICTGTSTTINGYPTGGLWTTNNGKATVSAVGVATGVDTGTVRITYTNTNACGAATATVNLTVIDTPAVKIVSAQPELCVGVTIQWIASVAGGTWTTSEPVVTVNPGGLVTGVAAGTATIKYTAGNICGFASDSAAITVVPPGPTPTISGNLVGCPGETSVLTGSVPFGVWSSTNSYIASIDATGIVTFIRNGTATIYYAVNENCITTKGSALVTVKKDSVVGAVYGMSSACEGSVGKFTANYPGGTWASGDPSILTVDNNGNSHFLSAGTTTVSYTIMGECGASSTGFVTVVLPLPDLTPITGKSVVMKGKTTELRGRAPYGLWSSDNPAVATIDQWGVVSGLAAGVANVTYSETNANGCLGAVTLAVKVIAAPEIDFVTFPNPASRILSISYTNSTVADAQMWLSDYTGRVVMTGNIDMPASAGVAQFNITGIPDGVYTVTIDSKDGGYVGKVVIIE